MTVTWVVRSMLNWHENEIVDRGREFGGKQDGECGGVNKGWDGGACGDET